MLRPRVVRREPKLATVCVRSVPRYFWKSGLSLSTCPMNDSAGIVSPASFSWLRMSSTIPREPGTGQSRPDRALHTLDLVLSYCVIIFGRNLALAKNAYASWQSDRAACTRTFCSGSWCECSTSTNIL